MPTLIQARVGPGKAPLGHHLYDSPREIYRIEFWVESGHIKDFVKDGRISVNSPDVE